MIAAIQMSHTNADATYIASTLDRETCAFDDTTATPDVYGHAIGLWLPGSHRRTCGMLAAVRTRFVEGGPTRTTPPPATTTGVWDVETDAWAGNRNIGSVRHRTYARVSAGEHSCVQYFLKLFDYEHRTDPPRASEDMTTLGDCKATRMAGGMAVPSSSVMSRCFVGDGECTQCTHPLTVAMLRCLRPNDDVVSCRVLRQCPEDGVTTDQTTLYFIVRRGWALVRHKVRLRALVLYWSETTAHLMAPGETAFARDREAYERECWAP